MTASVSRRIAYAQNFLTSPRLVEHLLATSTIGPTDTVYEIGPGTGIITARLALHCRRVIAIEKDSLLVPSLRLKFAHVTHVEIREADFLDVSLPRRPYKVFANIPFNITAAIVTKLITTSCPPVDAYLVVQREAAARFSGIPTESLGAILLKPWFEPTIEYQFRRTDFAPAPGTDVVLMRLRKRGPPLIARGEAQAFRDFVTYVFTARQPSICHTLRRILGPRQVTMACREAHLSPGATPTHVDVEQWIQLFSSFSQVANAHSQQIVRGADIRLKRQQAGLQKVHRTCTTIHHA